jgi:uncharacterized protein
MNLENIPGGRMARLPKGIDLLAALETLCAETGLTRGLVQVIGALEHSVVGYYRQGERRYVDMEIKENVEILSGLGNVSLKDGKPFVHLHLVLGREDGSCVGGHAMPGCLIFAAEAALFALDGPPLEREYDPETGLALWRKSHAP